MSTNKTFSRVLWVFLVMLVLARSGLVVGL